MKKRITAIAVTLILLYTIGGRNERVYSEGLYQGTERVQTEAGADEGEDIRTAQAAVERGAGVVRDDRSRGPVSGDAGERIRAIEITEVRDDGQRNGKNNMVFIELGITASADGDSFGGAAETDGNTATDDNIGPANDDYAGPGSEEPVEGTEPDTGENGTGPAADASGEVQPVIEEPVVEEPAPEPEPAEPQMEYLGDWTISFYCNCSQCCGSWSGGPTASGAMPTPWYTVATGDLPFGTILYIDGLGTFEVQDRGTSYGWADVFVSDHGEALANGLQTRAVYIVR